MTSEWNRIKQLVEQRNENIESLKFYHHGRQTLSQEQLDNMYPLDLDLMPLPHILVAYPFLRLVFLTRKIYSG